MLAKTDADAEASLGASYESQLSACGGRLILDRTQFRAVS